MYLHHRLAVAYHVITDHVAKDPVGVRRSIFGPPQNS